MITQSCGRLKSVFFIHPAWLRILFLCTAAILGTELECTQGMQVTSTGPQTIQTAEGESVTLGCKYTLSPSDTGELDIEWSVVSPDSTQKDQMLMFYTSGTNYIHSNQAFTKGLSFSAPNPSMGDASLSISVVSPAQSATYQCKVKKSPGVDTLKLTLVVMVKPSVPRCWVEGGELIGEAVSLNCKSEKGSNPLSYRWRRGRVGTIPTPTTQDSATGKLRFSNFSQASAGTYHCEVNNAVGSQFCSISLKTNKPPNRAAVIVGTVVGSLLFIFILMVFIAILYWKLSTRRRYEREFSNEIREDARPPESRPVSRHTRWSSSQYRHVTSCQVERTDESPFNDGCTEEPSSNSYGRTPITYDM